MIGTPGGSRNTPGGRNTASRPFDRLTRAPAAYWINPPIRSQRTWRIHASAPASMGSEE